MGFPGVDDSRFRPSSPERASSFLRAARLANLYLTDGVWNGERLLPEGWVDYASESAPAWVADGRPQYGGSHFWVNADGADPIPESAFSMRGAGGSQPGISSNRYFPRGRTPSFLLDAMTRGYARTPWRTEAARARTRSARAEWAVRSSPAPRRWRCA